MSDRPQIQGSKPASTALKKGGREERRKERRKNGMKEVKEGGKEGKITSQILYVHKIKKAKTPNNNTICNILIIID